MARVFVIEDNDGLRETVASYLKLEAHDVVVFSRLSGVSEAVAMQSPDLLILDVMLPDGDGFLFARRLREKHRVPIIFLTARTAESDRITGFEVGGDDYVVKPFSTKELMLRVKAVLARTTGASDGSHVDRVITSWKLTRPRQKTSATGTAAMEAILTMDAARHRATIDSVEIDLTGAEWKILSHLGSNPAVVISREKLLGECLEYVADGSERTIDTHVKNIRAKLGCADWIETVRGFGYRFAGEPLLSGI